MEILKVIILDFILFNLVESYIFGIGIYYCLNDSKIKKSVIVKFAILCSILGTITGRILDSSRLFLPISFIIVCVCAKIIYGKNLKNIVKSTIIVFLVCFVIETLFCFIYIEILGFNILELNIFYQFALFIPIRILEYICFVKEVKS